MALEMERVRQIAERVTASQGVELVELEFRGGGKARMLRLYIDKPGGVTHEDCAQVSRELGTILDVEDAVPGGRYLLEVSSPGLDRKLLKPADYERFAGSRVRLLTREPVEGNRHFEGRLQGLHDGRVAVELGGGKKSSTPAREKSVRAAGPASPARMLEIELSNVERANLVPEF
jgi:ribosome maturation factor RimP